MIDIQQLDYSVGPFALDDLSLQVAPGEHFVLLGKSGIIEPEDLPADVVGSSPLPVASMGSCSLKEAMEGPERRIILDVLESNNWNRNETAEALGINRTTLYKKMKKLGLEGAQQAVQMS